MFMVWIIALASRSIISPGSIPTRRAEAEAVANELVHAALSVDRRPAGSGMEGPRVFEHQAAPILRSVKRLRLAHTLTCITFLGYFARSEVV